jgi:hypothetical protein
MSRQAATLDTLALAVSALRAPTADPAIANELAGDVVPVIRALAAAARDAETFLLIVEPRSNLADCIAALLGLRNALAAFDAGRLPAPLPSEESHA